MTLSNSNDQQIDLNSQPSQPLDNNQLDQPEVHQISLLEEKLRVARRKQKVGEVVIRKQVETKFVKVPIKREKLIVERIGKNPELLTETIITSEKVSGFSYEELNDTDSLYITKSNFLELQKAQELLDAIKQLDSSGNAKVSLKIVTNYDEHQKEHQNICDRFQ